MPVAKVHVGKEINTNSQRSVWLWGKLHQTVYDKTPATIDGLLRIINNAAKRIFEATVRKAAANLQLAADELKNVH